MALVIPDELETAFKDAVTRCMEIEHTSDLGSNYTTCMFCGTDFLHGAQQEVEHKADCLGKKLLSLESVDVVKED